MVNYLVLNESNLVDIYENEINLLIKRKKEYASKFIRISNLFSNSDFFREMKAHVENNKINEINDLFYGGYDCNFAGHMKIIINGNANKKYIEDFMKNIDSKGYKSKELDENEALDKFKQTSDKIKNKEVYGFNYTNGSCFVEFTSKSVDDLKTINDRALSTAFISNFDKIQKYNAITPESIINDFKAQAKNDDSITKNIHPTLKVIIETEIIEESLGTDIIQSTPKKRNRL